MNGNAEAAVKGRSRTGKALMVVILALLIAALLLLTGYAYKTYNDIKELEILQQQIEEMEQVVNTDCFYDGLYMDSIPLGGKTFEEAEELFSRAAGERLDQLKLVFTYKDRTWTIDADALDAHIDWKEKLVKAYDIARVGKLENRYNRVIELKEKGLNFVSKFTYDKDRLKDKVEAIAKEIYKEPKNAEISFDTKTNKFSITEEEPGYEIDPEILFDNAVENISSWNFETINITPKTLVPEYKSDGLKKATKLISRFSTSIKGSTKGRRNNVELALKFVDGYKLEPNEVFSFNEVVGPSTVEAGFMMAPVIAADKSMVDGLGGGICQSSTTLYNAALMADLEIVERYHHSFPVSYVPKGLDASIYYGSADLKFRNNKSTPIFIKTYTEGDNVFVEIYGEPLPNGEYIRLESEVTGIEPAPNYKYIEDKTGKYVKKPGGQKIHAYSREGIRVKSYKVFYRGNKEVRRELIVHDYYRPIQGIIYYRK